MVTSAMLRTWPVRLAAIRFTLSVRSFQVPATPGTCAWPPSLPSVPTSRATRVTSEAKPLSWSTIVLMVFLSSRISPFTSTVIFLDKSPRGHGGRHFGDVADLAGQVVGHQVHVVGEVLPRAGDAFAPAPGRRACLRCRLRGPRGSLRDAKALSWSTIMLMVFLSSRISPFTSTVIFFDRSPRATAVVTSAMLRTWPVRLVAIALTLSVRSFQVPATPFTLRLAAELAFGADFARHARHFGGEGGELLDHRVDDLADAQELAAQRAAVDLDRHAFATGRPWRPRR